MRRRRLRVVAVAAVASTALAGAGTPACNGAEKGALMLAVSTDMKAPKDVSVVSVTIKTDSAVKHNFLGRVTPDGDVVFPATLAIIEPENPNATIRVRVVAFQEQKARILRDVRTTVPRGRTALLRVGLAFVNDGSGSGEIPVSQLPPKRSGGSATGLAIAEEFDAYSAIGSKCPVDQTSIDGACADDFIDSSTLPDFDSSEVARSDDPARCFDAKSCYSAATQVLPPALDLAGCTVALAGRDPARLNFALATPDTGECIGERCYVPLDLGPGGWSVRDKIVLAPGICRLLADNTKGVLLYESKALAPKEERSPLCQEPAPVGPSPRDASTPDGTSDALPDTQVDTGVTDTGTSDGPVTTDTGTGDTGTTDTGAPDTGVDTGTPDAGAPDTGPPDAGPADTGPADTGPADTGPADTGPADTGPPDAGPVLPSQVFPESYPTTVVILGNTELHSISAARFAVASLTSASPIAFGFPGSPIVSGPQRALRLAIGSNANIGIVEGASPGYVYEALASMWNPIAVVADDIAMASDGSRAYFATSSDVQGLSAPFTGAPTSITAIAMATTLWPVGVDDLLVGDVFGGIKRCTTGGCTGSGAATGRIQRIVGSSPTFYALADDGLHKSTDAGGTWALVYPRAAAGVGGVPYIARDMVVDTLCVFFTSSNGVEWYRRDGSNQGIVTTPPNGKPMIGVAIGQQPGVPAKQVVYYSVLDDFGPGDGGVYWMPRPAACTP